MVHATVQDRVPRPVKRIGRLLTRSVGDVRYRRRGYLVPPWSLRSQVPGDFQAVGQEFLGHMVALGGLRPDDRVLDIGCRAGRMAIPLTGYLGPDARYEGVDDWEEGSVWCQQVLTPRFPNFRFSEVTMEGGQNGVGDRQSAPVRLPFDDDAFDFVILGSIVHLSPASFHGCLSEVARVVRPGGTYFGTWFLRADPWTSSASSLSPPIACTEGVARHRLGSLGLAVEAVHRGSWDGNEPSLSYQDLIVARKML